MQPGISTDPAYKSSKDESHPFICFFHFLFKAVAAFYFIFLVWLFGVGDFVQNFIVLLVFVSCDFWYVKNVSGRYLVGLRWWNDNVEEGEGWRFETLEEGQREILRSEKVLFWGGIIGNVILWLIITFLTLFKPSEWEYLLICVIALMMGCSNFYGYYRCSTEAREMVRQWANEAATRAAASAIEASVASSSNTGGAGSRQARV